MKKSILLAVMACSMSGAFAQIKMPAPSPNQTIRQDFALGQIEVTYSRPNAKGRTVFGNLVPYDSLWRTGANNATRIKFTDAVEIGGKKIDTGTYAIYTIPHKKGDWEIILNKGISNWGVSGYKASDDVVRVTVPSFKVPETETFTISFVDVQYEKCGIQFAWAKSAAILPISSPVKDRVKAQIEQAMSTDKKPYWQAANFYYEWDKNLDKALPAVSSAIEELEQKGQKPFYMYLLKAKIQRDKGDKAGAKASATKCVEMAKLARNSDYIKMGNELISAL